jgi:hypothetical protein
VLCSGVGCNAERRGSELDIGREQSILAPTAAYSIYRTKITQADRHADAYRDGDIEAVSAHVLERPSAWRTSARRRRAGRTTTRAAARRRKRRSDECRQRQARREELFIVDIPTGQKRADAATKFPH